MRRAAFVLLTACCQAPVVAPVPLVPVAPPRESTARELAAAPRAFALAPVWRVAEEEARANWPPRLDGDRVVYVDDDRGWHHLDLRTGDRAAEVAFDARLLGFSLGYIRAGDLFVGSVLDRDELVGVGVADGRVRWRVPLGDGRMSARAGDAAGSFVVTTHPRWGEPTSAEFLAVDATGRVLARTPLPAGFAPNELWVTPSVLVATGRRRGATMAVGIERDGSVRWTRELSADARFARDGDAIVALLREGALTLLAANTGESLAEYPLGRRIGYPALAVADGVAYVAAESTDFEGTLFAVELATGNMSWRYEGPLQHYPQLAPTRGALYASTDGGTILGLDRATGRVMWRWGIGDDFSLAVAPDGSLLVAEDGFVTAFGPSLEPAPPIELEVNGTVTEVQCGSVSGFSVRVGDETVLTDERGRFHATVPGRGTLRIGQAYAGGTRVPFDGAREVTIEIEGDVCDYD